MPSRLFVGNLPYEATEAELRQHFAQVAPVSRVFIPLDRETGKARGFAFIEFAEAAHAAAAIQQLHQKPFKDRPLVVNEARPSEPRPGGGAPRPGPDRGPSRSPGFPPRERTPIGSGEDAAPARRAPSRPRRRGAKRGFWEDGPKKEPIPEKRRGQILGEVDEFDETEEVEADVEFDDFATALDEESEEEE
jgi:RNA recognition motif-containing protein